MRYCLFLLFDFNIAYADYPHTGIILSDFIIQVSWKYTTLFSNTSFHALNIFRGQNYNTCISWLWS